MKIALKNLLLSNTVLKIICLLLSYSFWYIASIQQTISLTFSIPLCFTTAHQHDIIAPEKIDVTLRAQRVHFYSLDPTTLIAHLDIAHLEKGKHILTVQEKNLFLPNSISIAHYKPSRITITITEKRTS